MLEEGIYIYGAVDIRKCSEIVQELILKDKEEGLEIVQKNAD